MKVRYPRPAGARQPGLHILKEAETTASHDREIRNGYVKSFDGTRLFYSVEGPTDPEVDAATAPTLVFCYGIVCSSLHWTYQIEYFKKNFRTVWFDYRGHQNSDMPADNDSLTIANIAKDLKAIVDELGIKDGIYLGHSMGVNVVLEFAKNHPEYIQAMILANGTAKRPLGNMFHSNIFETLFGAFREIYSRSPLIGELMWKSQKINPFHKALINFGGFNAFLAEKKDVDRYIEQMTHLDPVVFVHLIQSYHEHDCTPWMHKINVPTLIITGDKDHITPPEEQELMHQLLPNSQLEVIGHGSHCSQMDLPEVFNVKVEKYLDKLFKSKTKKSAPTPKMEIASQSKKRRPTRGRAKGA